MTIRLMQQCAVTTPLIAEFKMDLLNVYYSNAKHCMEDKWMAMINPKSGKEIRAIMKVSCQLIGPADEQNQLKFNPSDIKDPTVRLMLPPQLNPKVIQWTIKVFNGRNMKIEGVEWFSKIDPLVRVTIGSHWLETK